MHPERKINTEFIEIKNGPIDEHKFVAVIKL